LLFVDLPLRDASVDAILCDMPFGLKHSSVENMRALLPAIISSLNRFVRLTAIIFLRKFQPKVEVQ
jgi:tRNA G10  N-methylase Trm11